MNRNNIYIASSIALILVSGLSISSVVLGKGNPWDQVWEVILNIQTRLTTLEQEETYVHIVRFLDPSEHTVDTEVKTKIATFTLSPSDPSNNAILDYWFYFEYKSVTTPPLLCYYEIHIHGETGPGEGSSKTNRALAEIVEIIPSYEYTLVQKVFQGFEVYPVPNQSQYTIEVYFYRVYGDAMQVRNFNLILTYTDGIPASS